MQDVYRLQAHVSRSWECCSTLRTFSGGAVHALVYLEHPNLEGDRMHGNFEAMTPFLVDCQTQSALLLSRIIFPKMPDRLQKKNSDDDDNIIIIPISVSVGRYSQRVTNFSE